MSLGFSTCSSQQLSSASGISSQMLPDSDRKGRKECSFPSCAAGQASYWSLCLLQVSLPALLWRRPPPARPLGLQHRGPPFACHQEGPAGQTQRSGVVEQNQNLWSWASCCLSDKHTFGVCRAHTCPLVDFALFYRTQNLFLFFFFFFPPISLSFGGMTPSCRVYCHPLLNIFFSLFFFF